jgi:hypothetical protein
MYPPTVVTESLIHSTTHREWQTSFNLSMNCSWLVYVVGLNCILTGDNSIFIYVSWGRASHFYVFYKYSNFSRQRKPETNLTFCVYRTSRTERPSLLLIPRFRKTVVSALCHLRLWSDGGRICFVEVALVTCTPLLRMIWHIK